MSNKKLFYITTTLPYINSDPHIGFAAEIIKADVIARYNAQRGAAVFFNTGTDEHGLKIYQKAQEAGMPIQEYCDMYSEKFRPLKEKLNLSYTNFIRTTDANHQKAAQEFWRRCEANGDIYKKNYNVKYCVGCEMEKTDSDLVNGRCPLHPNVELEIINEENYFFRFSKYQEKLLALYQKNKNFVVPAHRLKEVKNFVESGLQDFSISRLKSKMPHGIAVPGDETQVMYVWFDALVNYISCLGWPENENDKVGKYQKYWPGLQVCGKDNLRPQSAMWQAMLMSAGLPNSEQILVFGFLTINGQKISKSAGNSVDPYELADKYGADAVRYYLLSEMSPFEDGDYSEEKFQLRYNADLANGIGNLSARVSNLLEKNEI
ncbi:MAG: methionine--tRNA ligase, partial [Patescibacteria group bacterium]